MHKKKHSDVTRFEGHLKHLTKGLFANLALIYHLCVL